MQPHVEQIDIFAYLEEIELQETAARVLMAQATPAQEPETLANIPQRSLISPFKEGLQWFLQNLPILFGLIQWVNVYTVKRAFGGSEAGGWYFRRYTCEESRLVWFWDAEAVQKMLECRFSALAWGILSSESVGQEIAVLIESHKASQEFTGKPLYDPERVLGRAPQANPIDIAKKPVLRLVEPLRPLHKDQVKPEVPIMKIPMKVINKILAVTGIANEEPCDRCGGSGSTPYTHIKNGICFKCQGRRFKERKSS